MPRATNDVPVPVFLRRPGLSAFTSHHSRRFFMPTVAHAFEKLCLIESGRGALEHGRRSVALAGGDVVRVPAGVPHRFVDRPTDPMTLSVLCVSGNAFASPATLAGAWQALLAAMPGFRVHKGMGPYETALQHEALARVAHEAGVAADGSEAMMLAAATQFVVTLTRAIRRARPTPWSDVERAVDWLNDHFTRPVRIDELAAYSGMSYRGFTTHFKRVTGRTVVQYVTRLRVAFAKRRIADSGDVVASAFEAGFADLSHFYRVFKRAERRTPGSLRTTSGGTAGRR